MLEHNNICRFVADAYIGSQYQDVIHWSTDNIYQ